jgi:membrane-associated protease RseP (regulator of RpoE activity)
LAFPAFADYNEGVNGSVDEAIDEEPVETSEREGPPSGPAPLRFRTNLVLFALTVPSVFFMGAIYARKIPENASVVGILKALPQGYAFAAPLLAILVAHELGHFVAARIHRVPASLPYFIPMPFLSPWGTMGAVITMPERIRSRNALLDIGASGPLAGLAVALPIWCWGIATSAVSTNDLPYIQEGQSILYAALKLLFCGPIPDGSDIQMNSLAFAGWVGALVTMINLVPVGQLDGGHIAYALFGEKYDRYATWIHRALLLAFGFNLVRFGLPILSHRSAPHVGQLISNSALWLVWFGMIALMKSSTGMNHPPTDPSILSPKRRAIAIASLVIFVLLFMPTPWARYE